MKPSQKWDLTTNHMLKLKAFHNEVEDPAACSTIGDAYPNINVGGLVLLAY